MLKEIRAYVQVHSLPRLTQMLLEIPNFPGMSVIDCEGFGAKATEAKQSYDPFISKKRIEILAPSEQVDEIVGVITKYAHSGRPGDGKVVVYNVENCIRIRTGERVE